MNDGVKDPFYDQVACARYRAERDMLAQAMDRVADDIEQTFLGFEGAEDAPAMRWARQFRAALGSLHAPVRDATTSACDLTPDEDREAAAWVREHGGLDVVKTCLMPEGMEWPRYDTGELVLIGDDVIGPDYGESIHVDEITFHANGFTLREKTGLDHWYENDDRFKRPSGIAADGEPLEEGQTVFGVDDGKEFVVVRPLCSDGLVLLKCGTKAGGYVYTSTEPEHLTHTKPEPPDSWERIEEDARLKPSEYTDRYRVGRIGFESEDMRVDLVRRCKALADEMEYDADVENAAKYDPMLGAIARMQVKYANRIREALGVFDD